MVCIPFVCLYFCVPACPRFIKYRCSTVLLALCNLESSDFVSILVVIIYMCISMWVLLTCTYDFLEVVVGSLGAAVGEFGLLSLLLCSLLRARVDGFTRLSYFTGVFYSYSAVYPSSGRVVI